MGKACYIYGQIFGLFFLLRDGVTVTRHFHKVKLRCAIPGPATNFEMHTATKKFEAPASPRRTSQTLNRGAEENRAVIVLRKIDASRLF